jgi:hypothetical protein
VKEHWVDILLHWVIPSCPVQEHWVDILLHWVIPSCPVQEHWLAGRGEAWSRIQVLMSPVLYSSWQAFAISCVIVGHPTS